MTRDEFEQNYLVEPIIDGTEVQFNVYKKNVLDFSTPKMELSKATEMEASFSGKVIGEEIRKFAFSLIEENYDIID